ncbi:MAG: hypothetical protein E6Q88_03185 [Lysobacteraceae bacterium]|nr:MAG: hypothetical protein E6Q88_03185 [Xanthomonadaceae bacterium]
MRRVSLLTLACAALAACAPTPRGVVFHAEGRPSTLGAWNVLQLTDGRLRPNAQVEPYALNTALFTDYAHKYRTIWMPPGTRAKFDAQRSFDFPVGTIITKTFYYPKAQGGDNATVALQSESVDETRDGIDLSRMRLIETRVLVRRKEGWIAMPYVWNAQQTEAELARAGTVIALALRRESGVSERFSYLVPDENQCASCHADDMRTRDLRPIGPKARHLDRDDPWHPGERQLVRMHRMGRLDRLPDAAAVPNARFDDASASIDARARAYLDINCGHCHSAEGPADTSGLWLDAGVVDAVKLGLCKPPVAAGQGTGDRFFDIVPGRPQESILVYRMDSLDPGAMMPEIGRSLIHREGVDLIEDWIVGWRGQSCLDQNTPVAVNARALRQESKEIERPDHRGAVAAR